MRKILIIITLLLNVGLAYSQSKPDVKTDTAQLKSYVLKETKKGGKLDFFTPIKGKEYESVQVKPGVLDTKIGMALYKWGKANFDLGLNKLEDAYAIFSEYKGRELNQKEKDYIKMGFNRELDK
jgi:hypothetical protein